MSGKLTLRLRDADARALDTAAEIIGGPSGAQFVGRTEVIRRALAAFITTHDKAQQGTGQ